MRQLFSVERDRSPVLISTSVILLSHPLAAALAHLMLAGPFSRQVGEADYSHAMRKASFDRRLDHMVARSAG